MSATNRNPDPRRPAFFDDVEMPKQYWPGRYPDPLRPTETDDEPVVITPADLRDAWDRGAAIGLIGGIFVAVAIGLLAYVMVVRAVPDPPAPSPSAALSGATEATDHRADRQPGKARPAVVPLSAAGLEVGTPIQAMRGLATTYETCDRCAAASGELQQLLGPHWLGMKVTVWHGGHHVTVRLVTGCACGPRRFDGELVPTTIDLSPWAFAQLAPTWHGVIRVLVVHGDSPALPPTDTEPVR